MRFFLLLVLVPGVLFAGLWALDQKGFFSLDHIEIVLVKNADHPRFLKPAVESLDAQLEKLRGSSLWRLDLEKMSAEIGALPWVGDLQVRRSWPDRLEVRIAPKAVKFLYMGHGTQLSPVLEDGTFLKPVTIESIPDVVLLRGDDFLKSKELLKRALLTLNEIPNEGSFSKKTISEIRYDNKDGFWVTLMKAGVRVKLGEDDIPVKANRVAQVLDYLDSREFDARVIDANLTKKVLVRLRKDP